MLGLLEELAKRHPVSESLLDAASELDKAYIPTRYPDALPEGAPFERYREATWTSSSSTKALPAGTFTAWRERLLRAFRWSFTPTRRRKQRL